MRDTAFTCRLLSRAERNELLRPHGRFLIEQYATGALEFAGSFGDTRGGVAFIRVNSLDGAKALAARDPATIDGTMTATIREVHRVYWAAYLAEDDATHTTTSYVSSRPPRESMRIPLPALLLAPMCLTGDVQRFLT
jgi:uncharacterized protein YciI